MGLGVLFGNTLGSGALGVASTIPGECWDQSGFKECFSSMYATAQLECRLQGKENDACITPRVDQLAKAGCKCLKKPTVSAFTPAAPSSSKEDPFAPKETKIMGFSLTTLLIVGAVAYGAYTIFGEDSKKGKG